MHSTTVTTSESVYECFGCGARTTEPVSRDCDRCGGELRNISRPRDL